MLITLKYNFKITTPQIVDKYISAETDPCKNCTLHDVVMRRIPYDNWCLIDGKCLKHYPKS